MELSRRFFLGGAIALVAVQTFKPSISMASNLPTIWGDGKHDDAHGFNALFAKNPVLFKKDQIGIENHEGVIIYKGLFKIDHTLEILEATNLTAYGSFDINAIDLPEYEPLIAYEIDSFDPSKINFKFAMRDARKVPLFQMKEKGVIQSKGNFNYDKVLPPKNAAATGQTY
jgi:hypothetical protein